MPRYQYIAISTNGRRVKGTIAAESPYAARRQLRGRAIHPTDITEVGASAEGRLRQLLSLLHKTSRTQIIDFTKQMATMLNSGIKLTEALSVLTLQVGDSKLRNAIVDIRDRVMTGESFTDALKDYGDFFDVIYVAMVRVGEVTGTLGQSMATIAGFMEKRAKVESKIITAMIYPIILTTFMLGAVLILTIKVIPPIAEQIERAGQQLPGITRALKAFGDTMTSPWLILVLAGFFGFVALVKWFLRTRRGASIRDRVLLRLPVFGPLVRQRVVARFASTLSTLLGSGLAMAESLRVVADTTGNTLMKQAVQNARERILAGADIATPLRDSGVIDPAIAHMVAVGEKAGELESMLKSISENLEASTDVVIERLSAAIEPLIIIVMAAVIGIIAYATLIPIIRFSTSQF